MNEMDEQTKKLLKSLIELLRAGDLPPWRKPWTDSEQFIIIGGVKYLTSKWPSNIRAPAVPYGVVNGILLRLAAHISSYRSNFWIAEQVVKKLKAPLHKGAKPVSLISFHLDSELWEYNRQVYNVDQIKRPDINLGFAWSDSLINTDMPALRYYKKSKDVLKELTQKDLKIKYGGNLASYVPANDVINMPELHQFSDRDPKQGEALYWGTLWHEVVHWTGPPWRLNRWTEKIDKKRYAFEELIAELGACLLCAHLKIKVDIRSASYVSKQLEDMRQNSVKGEEDLYNKWADLLEDDFEALIRAARDAERAKKYIIDKAAGRKNRRNKGKKTGKIVV